MEVDILFVSDQELTDQQSSSFKQQGIYPVTARGPLKTKNILKDQNIDTIVWSVIGMNNSLAEDLILLFNSVPQIPVILVTDGTYGLDYKDYIQSFFSYLDIQDCDDELPLLIEKACNQHRLTEIQTDPAKNEIEFKNVLTSLSDEVVKEKKDPSRLELDTPWIAVDSNEKKILTQLQYDEEEGFFSSLKRFFFS